MFSYKKNVKTIDIENYTIEQIDQIFQQRFNDLYDTILKITNKKEKQLLQTQLQSIRTKYTITTSIYYIENDADKYRDIVSSEQIETDLDRFRDILLESAKTNRKPNFEWKKLNVTPDDENKYNICKSCGITMMIDEENSVLKCSLCKTMFELVGAVFDDSQFYSQEGQKAKSGNFNPTRHFHSWWTRILALESEDEIGDINDPENQYGEKILGQMKQIIKRDSKKLLLLTINDIRNMLRELKRTDLNRNASLFLKKLTGIAPPAPNTLISDRVEKIFSKVVEIGEKNMRTNRMNRDYYPFYIYKILDGILPEDDYENRRIMFYIYLQSDDTLANDDLDWKAICEFIPEIEYRPTDKTKANKYSPINMISDFSSISRNNITSQRMRN